MYNAKIPRQRPQRKRSRARASFVPLSLSLQTNAHAHQLQRRICATENNKFSWDTRARVRDLLLRESLWTLPVYVYPILCVRDRESMETCIFLSFFCSLFYTPSRVYYIEKRRRDAAACVKSIIAAALYISRESVIWHGVSR